MNNLIAFRWLQTYYKGETQNGLRHGKGEYIYSNQFFRYVGQWKEGKKQGKGKLLMKDGTTYEGDFQQGEIVGRGKKTWADGREYTGKERDLWIAFKTP